MSMDEDFALFALSQGDHEAAGDQHPNARKKPERLQ